MPEFLKPPSAAATAVRPVNLAENGLLLSDDLPRGRDVTVLGAIPAACVKPS